MNFILRLKNKATLVALVAAVIPFIYQILALFGVTPAIAEDTWEKIAMLVINMLVGLGIVVDPTTKGIGDSALAQTYDKPNDGTIEIITDGFDGKADGKENE